MTKKRYEPIGPFAPPNPSEADQREGLPMAVAADEGHAPKAFLPTTQNPDQFAPDVAERYRDKQVTAPPRGAGTPTPHGRRVEERDDENRASETPSGYSQVDEHGFRHLEGGPGQRQAAEEDEASGRVNVAEPGRARGMTDDEDEGL